jgi:hypothetical protein
LHSKTRDTVDLLEICIYTGADIVIVINDWSHDLLYVVVLYWKAISYKVLSRQTEHVCSRGALLFV